MKDGKFTPEEKTYLRSLDAVEKVHANQIIYSKKFKEETMRLYHAGMRPKDIFAQAGLPSSLIGYKRIERAIYHWKEAERKDALTSTNAPSVKHSKKLESLKAQKRDAIARQRAIREKRVAVLEEKLAKQKKKAKTREQKIIASQAAEIAALKAQVKALKALGTFARRTKRAPQTTEKSERFEIIFQLKTKDPEFNIKAACDVLEISRSGYYAWVEAMPLREEREKQDKAAYVQVKTAFESHNVKKGSRQIKDNMFREQGVVMNLKKIQRLMRKYELVFKKKRKNPYHPIASDGKPRVAPNVVDRNFRTGTLRQVIATDITYLPCVNGFGYLSAVLDTESNELIAHVTSLSLEKEIVLDTYDQLKDENLAEGCLSQSDQGTQYTSLAFRAKLEELGITQSMSRRACCWDNACIESWFGRMKEQIGPTDHLTFEEVCEVVDNYIDYYNYHRGQERLGWLTPKEYAAILAA